jgi:hypothetical protein
MFRGSWIRAARHAAAATALGVLTACLAPSASTDVAVTETVPRQLSLLVRNLGARDVVIYYVRTGYPIRLGRAPSHSVTEVPITQPGAAAQPLQLILRVPGTDQSYMPEPVWLHPDRRVELTIGPLLSTSALILR